MASDTSVVRAARVSTAGECAQEDVSDKKVEGLINYLMRARHGSPFEHNAFTFRVEAPIFVMREMMRHRISSYNEECLAGSTVVTRLSPNLGGTTHKKNSTLEIMYRNWYEGIPDSKGRVRKLESCRNIWVRSYDETTLEPQKSKVKDIVRKGVQTTWLVTTESGKQIRSTKSHLYFTPEYGWKTLGDLKVGDYLYRSGIIRKAGEPTIPPRLRQGIQIWTTQMKPILVPSHGTNCYICDKKLSYAEAQLDHVVPVVLDLKKSLDEDNIKPVCKPCHRTKTNSEQKYADRVGSTWSLRADKIISIDTPVEEMTYDLVLEDPYHNFLANGLVVHNSGRYRELKPKFYKPDWDRKLQQVGKPGAYEFVDGTDAQKSTVHDSYIAGCTEAYTQYEQMLEAGVAREVARGVLPVTLFSTCYMTVNARSMMNFLSLRRKVEGSAYPSFPQREIELVAEDIEIEFERLMPVTHAAFVKYGRVSP